MIVEIDEMKEYLRIDSDDNDLEIANFIETAEIYLTNAGCVLLGPDEKANNLAKLAVKILVSHWYENREVEKIGTSVAKLGFSLDSIITQLKYCYGGENI
jgi:uncharacterized phage protein (predicted DNA packaging)